MSGKFRPLQKQFVINIHLQDFWYAYPKPDIICRLTTVIHELFHIDSEGQGFRCLPSKVSLYHGNSKDVYNYFMKLFVEQYLKKTKKKELYSFLEYEDLYKLCQDLTDPVLISIRKMRHHPLFKVSQTKMSEVELHNPNTKVSYL